MHTKNFVKKLFVSDLDFELTDPLDTAWQSFWPIFMKFGELSFLMTRAHVIFLPGSHVELQLICQERLVIPRGSFVICSVEYRIEFVQKFDVTSS